MKYSFLILSSMLTITHATDLPQENNQSLCGQPVAGETPSVNDLPERCPELLDLLHRTSKTVEAILTKKYIDEVNDILETTPQEEQVKSSEEERIKELHEKIKSQAQTFFEALIANTRLVTLKLEETAPLLIQREVSDIITHLMMAVEKKKIECKTKRIGKQVEGCGKKLMKNFF